MQWLAVVVGGVVVAAAAAAARKWTFFLAEIERNSLQPEVQILDQGKIALPTQEFPSLAYGENVVWVVVVELHEIRLQDAKDIVSREEAEGMQYNKVSKDSSVDSGTHLLVKLTLWKWLALPLVDVQ
jgi:hypothetical protein